MRDELGVIVRRLHVEYPNLKIVYVTSRSYGGYSLDDGSPEPWAYETAFAMKWLLQDQIDGDLTLNFEPAAGPVVAPLLLWGPYIWADGDQPRSDGLVWLKSDFSGTDGRHPSILGNAKVSGLLIQFFSTDPTSAPWFVANR